MKMKKKKKKKEKCVPTEKAIVTLKNHSEAERRRREWINGHFATLEGLLPSKAKMDKATLLAEVINHLQDLKDHAMQVSEAAEELIVESLFQDSQQVITIKASLCCNFRPFLFSDLKQAITSLKLKICHSEISTLEVRIKTLFILSSCNDVNKINNAEAHKILANAVLKALSPVLSKSPPLPEYSLRTTLSLTKGSNFLLSSLQPRLLNHNRNLKLPRA